MSEGFEEIEAVSVIDILRRAKITVVTAGVQGRLPTGSRGVAIACDSLLTDELERSFDAIVLPGGPGTASLVEHEGLRAALRRHAAEGALVAAICAAPWVLHVAGLLAGRKVACFPSVEDRLDGATIVYEEVVRDGQLITSRGAGTAIPFALALVAELAGEQVAREVGQSIIFRAG
ncbi:DJ-1 family protein [bacterium]|nr:DJ-1 family protein [bacterium]